MSFLNNIFDKNETKIRPEMRVNMKKVFKKVEKLKKNNKYEQALSYLNNFLVKNPGNKEIIERYELIVKEMIDIDIEKDNIKQIIQKYRWLSQFFKDQSRYTDYENIENFFDKAQEYNELSIKKEKETINNQDLSTSKSNENIKKLIEQCKNPELRSEALLEKINNLIESKTSSSKYSFKKCRGKIVSTINFRELEKKFDKYFNKFENVDQIEIKKYLYSHCKNILRELSSFLPELEKQFQRKLIKKIEELENSFIIYSREEKNKFLKKIENDNKKNYKIFNSKSKSTKLTKKINFGEEILNTIQKMVLEKYGGNYPYHVQEHLQMINDKLNNLKEKRLYNYSEWALKRIKKGFNRCSEYIKISKKGNPFIKHRPKLSKNIINYFGNIDTTYLVGQVSRIYSECFEYLFQALKVPKKNTFDKKNSKLYTLEKMNIKEKKKIESF